MARQAPEITAEEANLYFDIQEVQNALRSAGLSHTDIDQLIKMRTVQVLEVIADQLTQIRNMYANSYPSDTH